MTQLLYCVAWNELSAMSKCKRCGSYAINHHQHGRDGSDPDLCDVCYWRKRTEFAHDALQQIVEWGGDMVDAKGHEGELNPREIAVGVLHPELS